MNMSTKSERLVVANEILMVISKHGRQFFKHGEDVSHFVLAPSGKLWYIDSYTKKRVYVAYRGKWRHFTEGGTLKCLVENLRDFITYGDPIRNQFGPWPEWICDGDLWGYGESMEAVRTEIHKLLPVPELIAG